MAQKSRDEIDLKIIISASDTCFAQWHGSPTSQTTGETHRIEFR